MTYQGRTHQCLVSITNVSTLVINRLNTITDYPHIFGNPLLASGDARLGQFYIEHVKTSATINRMPAITKFLAVTHR